ncbi:MAG: sn-glycerol-3-phosphate ABC transporter ATP-binding protein UgpC [Proteobacteria bacterium]|nr:sn-glycerol-3-phosphate ABC transporter ATP-binding protein UgpC [Pseudomonadota bacterium]
MVAPEPSNVSIRGVDIAFGAVKVLKGLNLDVEQSEFLVLLGPSGCGKSTLLNAIAGLIEVSAGQIWIGGRNVTWEEPKDRGIAMVFQSYALYPRMSVRGNLSFGLKVARQPRAEIERRVSQAADMLKIGELLDRRPASLSGGQRQRVAIGRALVREAPVFLFDEPLSNLDAQLRAELRVEIKRLHQRIGATMIYVTHDQIEALTLADRIAVMQSGVIQQLDTPHKVYARPASRFVASFVGSPAMNFMAGRIVGADGRLRFESGDLRLGLDGYAFSGSSLEGRSVTLGIRPEHVAIVGDRPTGLQAAVELMEPMGAESLVWCRLAGSPLSIRVGGDTRIAKGDVLPIEIPPGHLSLFDDASGERL